MTVAGGNTPNFLWAFEANARPFVVYKLNPETLETIDSFSFFNDYELKLESGKKTYAGGPDGSLYVVAQNVVATGTYIARIYPDFNIDFAFYNGSAGTSAYPGLASNDYYLWAASAIIGTTIKRWPIDSDWSNLSVTNLTVSGSSPNGSRVMIYVEEYDGIIYGGQNTSGAGDPLYAARYASTGAPNSPTTMDLTAGVNATDGGWLNGDYIAQSKRIVLNNQYNGDIYYRFQVSSAMGLSGQSAVFQPNDYQYGGTVYLANVLTLDGAVVKQGVGLGFSYYAAADKCLSFDSEGNAVRSWGYQAYGDSSLTHGAFQNGTTTSCGNPVSKLYYMNANIGSGPGTDIVAWEIDYNIQGFPRLVANTPTGVSSWSTNLSKGICHSSPDSHRQIYTPI